MQSSKKIAVVGAGIAGLAAAYELKKAGFDVTVFESSAVAGGRMNTKKTDGWTFDGGSDFLQDNYTLLKQYAEELGVEWVPSEAGSVHRMIRGGVAHNLEIEKATDVLRLGFLPLRARLAFAWWCLRLRFGHQYASWFELSKMPMTKKYEASNAHEYLERQVSPEVAIYIADAFTSIMQFHRSKEIDVDAMNALMQIFVRPYDRFSIRYTPAGIAEIPRRMGEEVGVQCNHPVHQVESTMDGVLVDGVHFDLAISAVTADVAEKIIVTSHSALKEFLHSVRYAPTITIAFRLPLSLFPPRVHHSYVAYKENQIIAGYTNEGRKPGVVPEQNNSGFTLMNVYLHEEAIDIFSILSDKEVVEKVRVELPKIFPEIRGKESQLIFHTLKRWEKAMPKFTASHIRTVKAFEDAHQGEDSIYLIGDYMNAPWTEGAARCGKRVAELIVKKYG